MQEVDGQRVLGRARAASPRLLAAVLAGLLTGGFAAWAYYDDTFRPLAHTFGLWITTVALLSARQPRRRAIVQSSLALLAAVASFYAGKKIMYGIDYPGMPYAINAPELVEWAVLALLAGALLGSVFAGVGTPGRAGAIGTAAAVGLLAADAYRRTRGYFAPDDRLVIGFTILAIAAILVVAVRSPRQLLHIAAWSVPAAVLGFGLVSAPDALEQLLITGGF